ncbi:MAG: Uma2 family endonuclease [Sulfurimonas sp.]|nr:Uma2 family endonuclease [Sulfurimonas sp.]
MRALRLEDLPRYDYDDYKTWEGRWELINGVPYSMSPSPTFEHQNISQNISYELKRLLKKCKDCKSVIALDWIVSDNTIVCPDNVILCNETQSKFIQTPPKVIFEVLSPSTKKKDRTIKYDIFQEQGVKYYILLEPKGNFAEVYKLTNGFYKLKGEFTDEEYIFNLDECKINFSFKNIFES